MIALDLPMDTDPFDIGYLGLGPPPQEVRSIVVIQPRGFRSMVRAVPALRHLRRTFEAATIHLAAPRPSLELAEGCPFVDHAIELGGLDVWHPPASDIAISFAAPGHAGSSGTLESCSGVHVGWRLPGSVASDPGIYPVWPERLADSWRMLRLVWLLGGARPDPRLSLWPTLDVRNEAALILRSIEHPVAVLHPGAGDERRRWPVGWYGCIIEDIVALGLHPVIVGSASERGIADALRLETTAPFLDCVGATGVGTLAGLLERSAVFVGSDSGPAALAIALGVQSVIIAPESAVEQTGSSDVVSYVTVACPSCAGDDTCSHALADAAEVPLDLVRAAVLTVASRALGQWTRHQL